MSVFEINAQKFTKMVSNHIGEEFVLFWDEDSNGEYHCITIEPVFLDDRGQVDINDEGEATIVMIESYGTTNARNDYITPLFDGANTQFEENIDWIKELLYEAKTSWYEARHQPSVREQLPYVKSILGSYDPEINIRYIAECCTGKCIKNYEDILDVLAHMKPYAKFDDEVWFTLVSFLVEHEEEVVNFINNF